jgi:hypothetical protein
MEFELDKAVALLERTPEVLKVLLKNLPDDFARANEGGDSWSPFDVLGHLIYGEQTDWMVRTEIVLSEGVKKFEPFDRFAQFERSKGKTLEQLLAAFEQLRSANLNRLRSKQLGPDDLGKKAEHPELGEISLSQLLSAWVVHDLGHITQISRVIAKQYTNEVGPWIKYLTILQRTPSERT